MKTYDEIHRIICDVVTDKDFDRLQAANFDRWELDSRIARNGLRRLAYWLGKYGLTVADWDWWDAGL